jgi:carbohydrate kinase (thermoresistant glucokinase family)
MDEKNPETLLLVICGVSGAGKSLVGGELSTILNCPYVDADDLHPLANVQKMMRHEPLTDDDRWPWLELVAARMRQAADEGRSLILACSALKHSYREILRVHKSVRFFLLDVSVDELHRRLRGRRHFFPEDLLSSQLAALEPPTPDETDVFRINGNKTPLEIARDILSQIPSDELPLHCRPIDNCLPGEETPLERDLSGE